MGKVIGFPGDKNFVIKGNKSQFSNFVSGAGSYLPVYNDESQISSEGMDINGRPLSASAESMNLNNVGEGGGAGGGSSVVVTAGGEAIGVMNPPALGVMPLFPDFTKMSCKDLSDAIDNMTAQKMVGKNAELAAFYDDAIARAMAQYKTSCTRPLVADDQTATNTPAVVTPTAAAVSSFPWGYVIAAGVVGIIVLSSIGGGNSSAS